MKKKILITGAAGNLGGRLFDILSKKYFVIGTDIKQSNQNFKREYGDNLQKFQPWTSLDKTPYTILGPYLKELFDLAFIKGLHNPNERPPASMWEQALIKTMDLKFYCYERIDYD